MAWNPSHFKKALRTGTLIIALTSPLLLNCQTAVSQVSGDPYPCNLYSPYTGTSLTTDGLLTLCGPALSVSIGVGTNQGGSIGLYTSSGNAFDSSDVLADYFPFIAVNLITAGTASATTNFLGSHIFMRVDGGITNVNNGGYDYTVGSHNPALGGDWVNPPSIIGGHIEASWETLPITAKTTGTGGGTGGGGGGIGGGGGGTGGGTGTGTLIIDPLIEVDMKISFIHSLCRFEFDIINHDSKPHNVALGFLQSIDGNPNNLYVAQIGVPIQLSTGPYLHTEAALYGNQVPQAYSTSYEISKGSPTSVPPVPPVYRTIGAQLGPTSSTATEPTMPTRMTIGELGYLEGDDPFTGQASTTRFSDGTLFFWDDFWHYDLTTQFNPSQSIDKPNSLDEGVALYWDGQQVSPGNDASPLKIVNYLGDNSSSVDVGQPIALSVTAPPALPAIGTTTGSGITPPFQITAFVDNITDLTTPIAVQPVNLTINLPPGLTLASGSSLTQSIASVSPGAEQSVSWNVVANGSHIGQLTYTVTAQPNFGSGRIVQRTIEVPAPVTVVLKGAATNQNHYQMLSIPLQTGFTLPSTILFPGIDPNQVAPYISAWNQTTLTYQSVNHFTPGNSFWVLNRLANDQVVNLNLQFYPPLDITPGTQHIVNYNQGWNQIGDPYIYGVNFGEVQVFDPSTGNTYSIQQAASSSVHLLLPVAYNYDTSDPNPVNWHYSIEPNLSFQMQPYQGYWIYVYKPNLTFFYNGITTPFSGISKSAPTIPQTNAQQVTSTNWKQQLVAAGTSGIDQLDYIGITPGATDSADYYKYPKPPTINNQLSMDIVHPDWNNAVYGEDMRSASLTTKTWQLAVHALNPNETVTVTWPNMVRNIPRSWNMTLTDPASGLQVNMRNRTGYQVQTDKNGRATLQITASPNANTGNVQILSFTVDQPTRAAGSVIVPASVRFAMNGAGDAQILVRDSRGNEIRAITPSITRSGSAGSSGTAIWDLKNQQGVSEPSGVYTMELVVVSPSGQQTRRTQPLVLTR